MYENPWRTSLRNWRPLSGLTPNVGAVFLAALLLMNTALPLRTQNTSSEPLLLPKAREFYQPADYQVPALDKYIKSMTLASAKPKPNYTAVGGLLDKHHTASGPIAAANAASQAQPAWSRFTFWKAEPSITSRVCQLSLRDYDRELRTTIALIDAMHEDGLTSAERSFRNDCFSSLELPATMAAYDASIRKTLKSDVTTQKLMQTHFRDWLPRKNWITERIAKVEFMKRHDALQALADHIRKSYGLDPIAVHLVNLPQGIPLLGHYVPKYSSGKPAIIINAAQWAGLMDSPSKMLPVLLEETRHSIDHAAMQSLRSQKLSPADPQYFHAAIIAMNLQPAAYSRSNEVIGEKTTEEAEMDAIYSSQYVERTAKNFASVISSDLLTLQ